MRITIVSFNGAEASAINQFLDDLCIGTPVWDRIGKSAVQGSRSSPSVELIHEELYAQGNVVAGTELLRLYRDRAVKPRAVIFYGCAGALSPIDSNSVFVAKTAHYCSLGHVKYDGYDPDTDSLPPPGSTEKVRTKPKWIHKFAGEPDPLPPLSLGSLAAAVLEDSAIGIPDAVVAATDKVIEVARTATPPPLHPYPEEWTYAQSIAHIDHLHGSPHGIATIVDMESYGIAKAIELFGLEERVIVLRVTTDDLVTKNGPNASDQATILMDARFILADVIEQLLLR